MSVFEVLWAHIFWMKRPSLEGIKIQAFKKLFRNGFHLFLLCL